MSAYAGIQRRPPAPRARAPAGRGGDGGRQDQDQLRGRQVHGLGPAAVRVAARSAVLVQPAYLTAPAAPSEVSSALTGRAMR